MLKTINFQRTRGVSVFCFAVAVFVVANSDAFGKSTAAKREATHPRVSQSVIDGSVSDDPAVEKMLEPYSAKVRAVDTVIGKLDGELRKAGPGSGSLGNFVTDGMRAQGSAVLGQTVDLVITNNGGLRKGSIAPGDLRVRDIFELLPFENKLVALDLSGAQLLDLLRVVLAGREPQSGARIKYKVTADKKIEFAGATLIGADGKEKPIDPAAAYRVITIDYLLSVAGGNFAMLQQVPNRPLGITIR